VAVAAATPLDTVRYGGTPGVMSVQATVIRAADKQMTEIGGSDDGNDELSYQQELTALQAQDLSKCAPSIGHN
jgi:hypothetical protein